MPVQRKVLADCRARPANAGEGRRPGGLPALEMVWRRSDVLKPSKIGCLGRTYEATINVTQGCGHLCAYCYARGYRNYPGDRKVLLYSNLVEKLRAELARKRRLPALVYFSPSSDPFGPYREVQRTTYEAMRLLLQRRIAVSFLTKGYISRRFYQLFAEHRERITAQIGLISLNRKITRWLEPYAASPVRRLKNIRRLMRVGVRTTVRIDPMVPFVTDTPQQLTVLCRYLSLLGVKEVACAYLFLRPRIVRFFLREIPGPTLRRRIADLYDAGVTVPLHGCGFAVRLPAAKYRTAGYERLKRIASRFGIEVRICSCKNADLGLTESCRINGTEAIKASGRTVSERQLQLFLPDA